jgi:hypothetical protein
MVAIMRTAGLKPIVSGITRMGGKAMDLTPDERRRLSVTAAARARRQAVWVLCGAVVFVAAVAMLPAIVTGDRIDSPLDLAVLAAPLVVFLVLSSRRSLCDCSVGRSNGPWRWGPTGRLGQRYGERSAWGTGSIGGSMRLCEICGITSCVSGNRSCCPSH